MNDNEPISASQRDAANSPSPMQPHAAAHVGRLQLSLMLPLRIDANVRRKGAAGTAVRKLLDEHPEWTKQTASTCGSACTDHDGMLGATRQRQHHYQSFVYFHPFMQRLLNDGKNLLRYVRHDVTGMRVGKYSSAADADVVAEFAVTCCELVFVEPDVCVLMLDLRIVKDGDAKEPFSMARVQDLLDSVRRVFPPYFAGSTAAFGGHCPTKVTLIGTDGKEFAGAEGAYTCFDASFAELPVSPQDMGLKYPMAEHWRFLLLPLVERPLDDESPRFVQLGDDRAFVHALIAVPNVHALATTPRGRGDMVRLALLDDSGSNVLPYSAAS